MNMEDKKHYFDYQLKKILIIRSYTPLVEDIVSKLSAEFPECTIELLQAKNALPLPNNSVSIDMIHETVSTKGFLLRNILSHYFYFKNKAYDAVFPLYGTQGGLPNAYNLELYAYLIPARYHVAFDLNNNYKAINMTKLLFQRTIKFLWSQIMYLINVLLTILFFIYAVFWMIVFSPLTLFHKRKKRSTN